METLNRAKEDNPVLLENEDQDQDEMDMLNSEPI